MLKLKILKFNNIRRFATEQVIDFSSRDYMVQFDGKNINTGGSSGSGKSTIAMAIDYLFGTNEVPASSLQSFLTKEGIYVEAIFDKDGKEVVIKRSKKSGLVILIGDETFSGSSKLSEEKLDELIGMPREVFRKTYHKRQKEGGFFLDMTPKEIYDFLSDVLNVKQWTSKAPLIDQQIKNFELELEKSKVKKQGLEGSESNLQRMLESVSQPIKDFDDSLIPSLNQILAEIERKRSEFDQNEQVELAQLLAPVKAEVIYDQTKKRDLELKISQIKSSIESVRNENLTKISALRKSLSDFEKQFDEINRSNSKIPLIEQQKQSIMNEIKHLEDMKCPTCTQIWIGDSAKNKAAALSASVQELDRSILEIQSRQQSLPELMQTISRLQGIISRKEQEDPAKDLRVELESSQSQLSTLESEYKQLALNRDRDYSAAMDSYSLQREKIKSKGLADKMEMNSRISETKSKIQEIQLKKQSYENSLGVYNATQNNTKKSLDECQEQLLQCQKYISDLEEKITIAQESKRFIKSYVTKIFQDSLEEIGTKASSILSNIPNMVNANIYFETAKETKEGKTKEEVTGIINMDGENEFPIKSLSGGERTAIDLAVDFAVIDLIESRSGKGIDFFMLDEPFNGLDSVSSFAVVELLKTLDTNKRVIIIDHNPETKQIIGDTITVVRNGSESSVLL